MIHFADSSYDPARCAVFWKVREQFGGLSNMAGGFPLRVCGTVIRTSEALYQACRFPHLPEIQEHVIEQLSPMSAKMVTKPHRLNTRPGWDNDRVQIMEWCLRVKLAQNWDTFSAALRKTGNRPIVEKSTKDVFWGAIPSLDGRLVGQNVLGQLLTKLRDNLDYGQLVYVRPPALVDFSLLGVKIVPILIKEPETTCEDEVGYLA